MNIDRGIVNRALEAAGQERLNDQDIENDSARWRLIKDNYLNVILTTLNNTAWASCIRRAKLISASIEPKEEIHDGIRYKVLEDCYFENHLYHKDEYAYFPEGKELPAFFELDPVESEEETQEEPKKDLIENLSSYRYVYFLPEDCAKPEALNDNAEYVIEGRYLYTNSECNILQYVTNGKRPEDTEITEEEQEEDYPEYNEIKFDPALSEYIELLLAAKIALKITGDPNTYGLLYNNAMIIENNARKANLEHAHSKERGEEWWGDRIGLSVEGK